MPILVTCECGKQFQAKDENVGRRFNCPDCGREVTVPKPGANPFAEPLSFDAAEAKTSGKAITSLVLGILSFFCNFITGIPALIFGALSLSDIGKSNGRLGGKGLAIGGIITGAVGTLLAVPVLIALLLPAVQAAREAARRTQCVNNLKHIGLGFHNMASANNDTFPASAIVDKDGKPLLSWRVAILPFIDQKPLYDQFKLDEPWDSPSNIKLLAMMPAAYGCPSDPGSGSNRTKYQVITGTGAIFEGTNGTPLKAISDGTSNTILVIEAATPVEWTKPDDVDIAQVVTALGSLHPGGANVVMADGSVRFFKKTISPMVLQSLSTRAGNEAVGTGMY